jgi:hypothetical protein
MKNDQLDRHFPRYTEFEPKVPVWCVTPDLNRVIHRFFDTCPVSPSGRYLALTRLPYEDRLPQPGDSAEIVIVDLQTGTSETVAQTRGWDTQLGAQAQWGADDTQLFYNEVNTDNWQAFGVKHNIQTGEKTPLDGTVYVVSPDGKQILSPCLLRVGATQAGYGVHVPKAVIPVNVGVPEDDGIILTNAETGKSKLLVSFKDIIDQTFPANDMEQYGDGAFYGFHVKWNPQGTRIMFVPRYRMRSGGYVPQVVTMNADGTDIRTAIPASEWHAKGGHHPDWCPDGTTVMMNLKMDGQTMRFVKAKYDGSEYGLLSERAVGSGHPSLHRSGKFIVTDAYLGEPQAFGDGTVPIRLIDIRDGSEQNLIRVHTMPEYSGPKSELRVDPHPVWTRDHRYIVFNACPSGTRKVFIADLSEVTGSIV